MKTQILMRNLFCILIIINLFVCCSDMKEKLIKTKGKDTNIDQNKFDDRSVNLNNYAMKLYDPLNIDADSLSKAISLLDSAINLDSNYYLAYSNKAQILSEQGDNLKAIATLKIIEKREPEYVEGVTYQGILYYKMGRLDSTRSQYKKAIKLYEKKILNKDKNYLSNRTNMIYLKLLINSRYDTNAALDSLKLEMPADSQKINAFEKLLNDPSTKKMMLD